MSAAPARAEAPAALIYYPDERPGISRQRCGRGFTYFAPDGTRIQRGALRARIEALAVPPAYCEVWISPHDNGHLQATGRDERARKQYRYHADWEAWRARRKFARLGEFGAALPALRRRIARGLRAEAGDEALAVAAVLALMDRGSLRMGAPGYTRENGSYGASTLRARHVSFDGATVRLTFTAKGGAEVEKSLTGPLLAEALQKIQDLPGAEMMSWLDEDGSPRAVRSEQVNGIIEEVCGPGMTAKTFRTWNGTLAAFNAARSCEGALTISAMTEAAAEALHNTPAIARSSYIHPEVIALSELDPEARADAFAALRPEPRSGLRQGEAGLIAWLEGGA